MIRMLEEKDIDAVIDIVNDNWERSYSGYINPALLDEDGRKKRKLELEQDFHSKRLSEYVWEEQGKVLALLSIGDTADHDKKGAFEIWRIYVEGQAQGKHIGKQCLRFAEEEAKRRGYQEIIIWAFQNNQRAIAFYQKNGYVIDKNEYLGNLYSAVGTRLRKEIFPAMGGYDGLRHR